MWARLRVDRGVRYLPRELLTSLILAFFAGGALSTRGVCTVAFVGRNKSQRPRLCETARVLDWCRGAG